MLQMLIMLYMLYMEIVLYILPMIHMVTAFITPMIQDEPTGELGPTNNFIYNYCSRSGCFYVTAILSSG